MVMWLPKVLQGRETFTIVARGSYRPEKLEDETLLQTLFSSLARSSNVLLTVVVHVEERKKEELPSPLVYFLKKSLVSPTLSCFSREKKVESVAFPCSFPWLCGHFPVHHHRTTFKLLQYIGTTIQVDHVFFEQDGRRSRTGSQYEAGSSAFITTFQQATFTI